MSKINKEYDLLVFYSTEKHGAAEMRPAHKLFWVQKKTKNHTRSYRQPNRVTRV